MSTTDGAAASKIRYLASCHEADNRETSVSDLFHQDVRHLQFLEGTEVLLSGLQDGVAVPAAAGLAALEEASAYRRERSLIYGAFLLAGSMGRKVAAPLLYYPASLHRAQVEGQDVVLLRASTSDANLNFPVLAELLGEQGDDALESLLRRIPACPFLEDSLSELIQILADFFPRVDASALYGYPKLASEAEVRRAQREARLVCLPAAAMALIENPRGSRGVLSELARVAAGGRLSAPLEALFESAPRAVPAADVGLASIPATLSRSQQKVLQSARRHPLTLIVGPPGTGKSYTVSALALEHVARGDSVLIACRTEQALDVIEAKLGAMLGQTTPVLRGGSKDYTRELKNFLSRLLSGGLEVGDAMGESRERPEKTLRRLRASEDALAALERRLAKRNRLELKRGDLGHAAIPRAWESAFIAGSSTGGSRERRPRGSWRKSSSPSSRSGSRKPPPSSRARAGRASNLCCERTGRS